MSQIADQFVGLPIEDLITGPLVGIAKGQAKLNEVTWDYVQEVAFETGSVVNGVDVLKTRAIDVQITKAVTNSNLDTGSNTDGSIKEWKTFYSKVPMIALIPLPSLAVTKADINFTMEVKESSVSKDTTSKSGQFSASMGYSGWGFNVKDNISGKVATTKENTRSTDNSAKYVVNVHAEQLKPTEGMLKLYDAVNSMIEPVDLAPSGSN